MSKIARADRSGGAGWGTGVFLPAPSPESRTDPRILSRSDLPVRFPQQAGARADRTIAIAPQRLSLSPPPISEADGTGTERPMDVGVLPRCERARMWHYSTGYLQSREGRRSYCQMLVTDGIKRQRLELAM
jgi:hypothetical protein